MIFKQILFFLHSLCYNSISDKILQPVEKNQVTWVDKACIPQDHEELKAWRPASSQTSTAGGEGSKATMSWGGSPGMMVADSWEMLYI